MASKLIEYDSEARTKIKKGVDKLANAVKVTLGPKGRNVILEKKFGAPTVTKDGVSVAKEIELEDATETPSFVTETPSFLTVGAPNFFSRITLRPLGPNVILEKKFGAPTVTKDGV